MCNGWQLLVLATIHIAGDPFSMLGLEELEDNPCTQGDFFYSDKYPHRHKSTSFGHPRTTVSHVAREDKFHCSKKHCFAIAIAAAEQIVSGRFDKMRWIRREIYVSIRHES